MRARPAGAFRTLRIRGGCLTVVKQREGQTADPLSSWGRPGTRSVSFGSHRGVVSRTGRVRRSRRTRKEFQMEKAYRRVTRRFGALLAIASVVALLFVAAPASAATSAEEGYSTSARIEQTVDPGDNQLPFTGLDVLAVVAVGGALLAVGIGVRKLASSNAA